ncbi:ABC-type multidrug transport system fused ATPase/permease subunit [Treponema pedis]
MKILTGMQIPLKEKISHKFNFYLNTRFISVPFEAIEREDFLDLKAKAEKYLYGYESRFGSLIEEFFTCFGHFFALIMLTGIISRLSHSIIAVVVFIAFLNRFIFKKMIGSRMKTDIEMSVHLRRLTYFNNTIQDFQYGKEIRSNVFFNWFSDKYKEKFSEFYALVKKMSIKMTFGMLSLTFIDIAQVGIGYFYVIKKAALGLISVGEFSMYLTGITNFASSFQSLMQTLTNLSEYKNYYKFYKEYMSIPIQTDFGKDKPALPFSFDIEFQNVSFKYGKSEKYALQNVSVKFNSKERIAVIGENGAGKSTFVKLLMRLYEPTNGKILINGIDIKTIDYDYYQTWFAAVFQDFKLFSFSIKENITFGKTETEEDKKRFEKIVESTGLKEVIEKLNKGVDTLVYRDFDDAGFTPSGGQGQKIAIARAAYKNAPIAILDEPTAALDPKAENKIYEQFDEFFKDKCSLYISHRMAVTKFSDRTLVFDNAKIVQDGNHEELINQEGKYKELYELQAKFYV